MKFLVIRKPRAGAVVQPTSQLIRAQKEGLLGAIKRGDADCAYAFVGGGGISILNANSADEVNQRLFGSPLGFFYDFEVHALADYSTFMDSAAESLDARAKQR